MIKDLLERINNKISVENGWKSMQKSNKVKLAKIVPNLRVNGKMIDVR